jgi:four helix bundle protein
MSYQNFMEMPVWQIAAEIVEDVYQLTAKLPKQEDYALCGQMRKAAVSIAGNIAEGFGRHHTKDKLNFYFFSRGSAHEEISHLYCAGKVGYFTNDEIKNVEFKCRQVIQELNKLIKSLTFKDPLTLTSP